MYEYRATVVSVYDGDTATFDVDLGFFVHLKRVRVRLAGINAPEMVRGVPAGVESRNYLRTLIPVGSSVTLRTVRDRQEKYGRWLASITNSYGVEVNDEMISAGHAVLRP